MKNIHYKRSNYISIMVIAVTDDLNNRIIAKRSILENISSAIRAGIFTPHALHEAGILGFEYPVLTDEKTGECSWGAIDDATEKLKGRLEGRVKV